MYVLTLLTLISQLGFCYWQYRSWQIQKRLSRERKEMYLEHLKVLADVQIRLDQVQNQINTLNSFYYYYEN